MASDQHEEPERYSRDLIPDDWDCQLCDADPWPSEQSYKMHMLKAHDVRYELSQTTESLRQMKADNKYDEPTDLPPWAKMAIIRHKLYGETYKEIAETMGKAPSTLSKYASTPAGKAVQKQVEELSDVKNLVKMMMDSATIQMYADWLMAFEWAKSARDYKQIHTMMKDIGLQPILEDQKKQQDRPQTLILNLGTNDLRAIETATSHTIPEAEVEIEDAD